MLTTDALDQCQYFPMEVFPKASISQGQCAPLKHANAGHGPTMFLIDLHAPVGNSDANREPTLSDHQRIPMNNTYPSQVAFFSIPRPENTVVQPTQEEEPRSCTKATLLTSNASVRLPKCVTPSPVPVAKPMDTLTPECSDNASSFLSLSPIEDALLREAFIGRFTL